MAKIAIHNNEVYTASNPEGEVVHSATGEAVIAFNDGSGITQTVGSVDEHLEVTIHIPAGATVTPGALVTVSIDTTPYNSLTTL